MTDDQLAATNQQGLAIGRWLMYIYDMKKRSMQEPTFLILTALAAGPQHGCPARPGPAATFTGR